MLRRIGCSSTLLLLISLEGMPHVHAAESSSLPPVDEISVLEGRIQDMDPLPASMRQIRSGKLLRIAYPDGRRSFGFVLDNNQVISFSSKAKPIQAINSHWYPIDGVTLAGSKGTAHTETARGMCRLRWPATGSNLDVYCDSESPTRRSLRFVSGLVLDL